MLYSYEVEEDSFRKAKKEVMLSWYRGFPEKPGQNEEASKEIISPELMKMQEALEVLSRKPGPMNADPNANANSTEA